MENGFQGKEGQQVPLMTDEIVNNISNRYIELYQNVSGKTFIKEELTEKEWLQRLEHEINTLIG